MIRVGVTGGIGSGKSTLCRIWAEMGAYVIYADDLAKAMMAESPELVARIKGAFGEESYLPDGSLNRPWLADQAFAKGRVGELNAIVHPAVFAESDRLMDQAEKQGYPMAVREAAVMLEYGRPKTLDRVVLVLAAQKARVDRVTERDEATPEQVGHRISRQPDFEGYTPLADLVVRNDGSLEEFKQKARSAFHELLASM